MNKRRLLQSVAIILVITFTYSGVKYAAGDSSADTIMSYNKQDAMSTVSGDFGTRPHNNRHLKGPNLARDVNPQDLTDMEEANQRLDFEDYPTEGNMIASALESTRPIVEEKKETPVAVQSKPSTSNSTSAPATTTKQEAKPKSNSSSGGSSSSGNSGGGSSSDGKITIPDDEAEAMYEDAMEREERGHQEVRDRLDEIKKDKEEESP